MGDLNPLAELRERLDRELDTYHDDDRCVVVAVRRDKIQDAIADWAAEHPELGVTCGECDSREGHSHYCLLWSINTPDAHYCRDARPKQEQCPNCGAPKPYLRGHHHCGLGLTHYHEPMGNHQAVKPCDDPWHARPKQEEADDG